MTSTTLPAPTPSTTPDHTQPRSVPTFSVIGGAQVADALAGRERATIDLVRETYLVHHAGATINPPSYFLRFPSRPDDRIIALPASVGGTTQVDGIKWIASVPGNVQAGIPRASAVSILNDPLTGYPIACIESSIISATRTAASAALAAVELGRGRSLRTMALVGAGLIGRYVIDYLLAAGLTFDRITVCDLSTDRAQEFAQLLRERGAANEISTTTDSAAAVRSADLVALTTVAPSPYLTDPADFAHHPLVLNVSLRDVGVDVVLGATNIVDDVEHCLKANTSPHLAEQQTGNRDFLAGTLADVMTGAVQVPADSTVVFSPFGLGVLDLALAKRIHDDLAARGELTGVDGFFHELQRLR